LMRLIKSSRISFSSSFQDAGMCPFFPCFIVQVKTRFYPLAA
jgi:hypothetical protein